MGVCVCRSKQKKGIVVASSKSKLSAFSYEVDSPSKKKSFFNAISHQCWVVVLDFLKYQDLKEAGKVNRLLYSISRSIPVNTKFFRNKFQHLGRSSIPVEIATASKLHHESSSEFLYSYNRKRIGIDKKNMRESSNDLVIDDQSPTLSLNNFYLMPKKKIISKTGTLGSFKELTGEECVKDEVKNTRSIEQKSVSSSNDIISEDVSRLCPIPKECLHSNRYESCYSETKTPSFRLLTEGNDFSSQGAVNRNRFGVINNYMYVPNNAFIIEGNFDLNYYESELNNEGILIENSDEEREGKKIKIKRSKTEKISRKKTAAKHYLSK